MDQRVPPRLRPGRRRRCLRGGSRADAGRRHRVADASRRPRRGAACGGVSCAGASTRPDFHCAGNGARAACSRRHPAEAGRDVRGFPRRPRDRVGVRGLDGGRRRTQARRRSLDVRAPPRPAGWRVACAPRRRAGRDGRARSQARAASISQAGRHFLPRVAAAATARSSVHAGTKPYGGEHLRWRSAPRTPRGRFSNDAASRPSARCTRWSPTREREPRAS